MHDMFRSVSFSLLVSIMSQISNAWNARSSCDLALILVEICRFKCTGRQEELLFGNWRRAA